MTFEGRPPSIRLGRALRSCNQIWADDFAELIPDRRDGSAPGRELGIGQRDDRRAPRLLERRTRFVVDALRLRVLPSR